MIDALETWYGGLLSREDREAREARFKATEDRRPDAENLLGKQWN